MDEAERAYTKAIPLGDAVFPLLGGVARGSCFAAGPTGSFSEAVTLIEAGEPL